jgi:hypothetical protein
MLKSKWSIALAFLACALFLATNVNAKNNPMARPFMIKGSGIVQMLDGGKTLVTETGTATHLGKYTATGNGQFDSPIHGFYEKSVYIAANGDELWLKGDAYILSFTATECIFTMDFEIIGGTGRFDGATGKPDPVTVTGDVSAAGITYSYITTGTITY